MGKRRKSEGWNLQTNVKSKPGAQGTLFSGGLGQRTPESRQPRGYSPERLKQVQGFFGINDVTMQHRGVTSAAQGPWAQTAQTIARSTVDLPSLRSPHSPAKGVPGTDTWGPGVHVGETAHSTFAGHYEKPRKQGRDYDDAEDGRIVIRPDEAQNSTIIHELGHHHDFMHGTPQDLSPGTPEYSTERGREEGYADKYAAEHSRKPGYKRRPANDYVTRRRSGEGWSAKGRGYEGWVQPSVFNDAYRETRRPNRNLQSRQFGRGHGWNQNPLFDRRFHLDDAGNMGEHWEDNPEATFS